MSSNQNSEIKPPQITNQPEQTNKEENSEKFQFPQFDPEKFKSAENCNHCKNCPCPCHFRERGEKGERGMRGRGMHGRGMFRGFPFFPPWMMHRGFGRGHAPPSFNEERGGRGRGERGERGRGERGRGMGPQHWGHPWGHHWGPPQWGWGPHWGGNWGEEHHRPRGHSSDHYDTDMGYGNYGYGDYDYENKGDTNKNNETKK